MYPPELMEVLALSVLDTSFSPTAESFGVSAQIGSRVVRGGPEDKVPRGFHEGSTRVLGGFLGGFWEGAVGDIA